MVQEKYTGPVKPPLGVTVMVDVFPLVAPGVAMVTAVVDMVNGIVIETGIVTAEGAYTVSPEYVA